MDQKENSRWFIYPGNDETNDAIYNTMNEMGKQLRSTTISVAGKPLPVLETDPDFIRYFRDGKIGLPIEFKIFWQHGDSVRNWRLHEKTARLKAKASRLKNFTKKEARK